MRPASALALIAVLAIPAAAAPAPTRINLRTKEGVAAARAEWRYADIKLVEVATKDADGKPITAYSYEPKATGPDFDDSSWTVVDPTTLGRPRGGTQICFAWYRTRLTIPAEAKGKRVFFQTVVDDYGEVWVDGKLPRAVGKGGEAVVAGFNTPNRLELKGAEPGKTYQIAIFGINGPISATPANRIFLGETFLELAD